MSSVARIEQKIEAFISRFYKNQLIKGFLFFVAIGLSYLVLSLLIEYFLWLNPAGRAVIFWSFISVEAILLIKFLCIPLARLLKLSKGIDYATASEMIGAYFPEVSDKLINTLQLKESGGNSDLALASIEQKSKALEPIPFSLAIDYKKNGKYLKYALIPVIAFLIANFATGEPLLGSSYKRLMHYSEVYEKPAPFSFLLNTNALQAIENKPFTIKAQTLGDQVPDQVQITIGGDTYFMKRDSGTYFTYEIENPQEDLVFNLSANEVTSNEYLLKVIKVPFITDFGMQLQYPPHTGMRNTTTHNSGNATVPEGTKITWNLKTLETKKVEWITPDTSFIFVQQNASFDFSKAVYKNTQYNIATSNTDLSRYESLAYSIDVIPDAFPDITVEMKKDSIHELQQYHLGNLSDDYGLRSLQVVYYPIDNPKSISRETIPISKGSVSSFVYTFPGSLRITTGVGYSYYFRVTDNDAVNRYKSSNSTVFSFRKPTAEELIANRLEEQKSTTTALEKNLEQWKKEEQDMDLMRKLQKEKEQLDYNDQQQLKDLLKEQQQRDKMMERFTSKLKKNLEDFAEQTGEDNEALRERLTENEEELKRQEELMDELRKIADKLDKEELSEKLDDLAKRNKNNKKSLEQMLELAKRFFVEEKVNQIAQKLQDLGAEQEKMPEQEDNSVENQEELNEKFDKLIEDLEQVKKENQDLKNPIDVAEDKSLEESINKDQEDATESLKDEQSEAEEETQPEEESPNESPDNKDSTKKKKAQQKQKQAGKKMKSLGKQMQMQMAQGGGEQLQEDVDMLRQILDNLIVLSIEEEELMDKFDIIELNNPNYSKYLIHQSVLRENFEHVDDSLFALSLRSAELGERINEQLTNVDYSLNQALERLAESQLLQGTASQQYVITGANILADMLSEILSNMQDQLSSMSPGSSSGSPMPGKSSGGKGRGEQLQDIIMSQEQLGKSSGSEEGDGEGSKAGKEGGKKEGSNGDEGEEGEGASGDKEGNNKDGSGQQDSQQGLSEKQMAEQYRIFKEQEQIRNKLQEWLNKENPNNVGKDILEEMNKVEDDILNGKKDNANRALKNIQHQLMKLQEAQEEQGKDEKREAETNKHEFSNPETGFIDAAKKYFNVKEILNREALPLEGSYKNKVKAYYHVDN